MANFDWSRFTVRITVNASAEKLYWCWATKEGIEYWFLRRSDYKKQDGSLYAPDEYIQKGDSYSWWWFGYSDDVTENGNILECNGKDLFKFKFGQAGNCTIKIYEEQGQKIVELTQDEIPTDEKAKADWHVGCKTGWTFYLANMKSLLEGGVDLRNKNEKIQNVISA